MASITAMPSRSGITRSRTMAPMPGSARSRSSACSPPVAVTGTKPARRGDLGGQAQLHRIVIDDQNASHAPQRFQRDSGELRCAVLEQMGAGVNARRNRSLCRCWSGWFAEELRGASTRLDAGYRTRVAKVSARFRRIDRRTPLGSCAVPLAMVPRRKIPEKARLMTDRSARPKPRPRRATTSSATLPEWDLDRPLSGQRFARS